MAVNAWIVTFDMRIAVVVAAVAAGIIVLSFFVKTVTAGKTSRG